MYNVYIRKASRSEKIKVQLFKHFLIFAMKTDVGKFFVNNIYLLKKWTLKLFSNVNLFI